MKNIKQKTSYEIYKSIRKPMAPPGFSMKSDKSEKYNYDWESEWDDYED